MRSSQFLLACVLASFASCVGSSTPAQINPDQTLEVEASVVTTDREVQGALADLIEGGAIRGPNLFHSFDDFSVLEDQRVYFDNPAGIESILSRVTGDRLSNIFGTLGVDGTADLFLINPNGIIFGPNANLDIEGSFHATSAEAVSLGDAAFSAVAPEQNQLLAVRPSTSFFNYLTETSGKIVNRGQLGVGGDLSLAASRLELQGQIVADAGLSLLASDTVQIRDTPERPFIALASTDLLVQGNQQIDIIALSHPDSGLFSYGNTTLQSAAPINGDAHYFAGGNFHVKKLEGEAGSLFSLVDPIIRVVGDVVIEGYEGTSLHIIAGGSVDIGTVIITAPEQGTANTDFIQETVTLTDGSLVDVDGRAQPTLDIRAGVEPASIGVILGDEVSGFSPETDLFAGDAFSTDVPTSATITVGDVLIAAPGGLVLLSNQYEANADIAVGDIIVTGNGVFGTGIDATNAVGEGGTVFLDARNDITVLNSAISTVSLGDVGDIVLIAGDTVTIDGVEGTRATAVASNIFLEGQGTGGDVRISASNLNISNGAQINSLVSGRGQGGDIVLNIRETARLEGSNLTSGSLSGINTQIESSGQGKGGDIRIAAGRLEVLEGAQINASTFGIGNAGNIALEILNAIQIDGVDSVGDSPSGIFSRVEINGEGAGGNIQVSAGSLEVLNGGTISTSVNGLGDARSIDLSIRDTVLLDGALSTVESSVQPSGVGQGSNVTIRADDLVVSNNAQVSAGTLGVGNAGDLTIAADSVQVLSGGQIAASTDGFGNSGNVMLNVNGTLFLEGANATDGSPSSIGSFVRAESEAEGGDIQIFANDLEAREGAVIGTVASTNGEAGNVTLEIGETVRLQGINAFDDSGGGIFSSLGSNAMGQSGSIQLAATNLEVLDGAQISASTLGSGDAGDVTLNIRERTRFAGVNAVNGSPSGAFSSISPSGEGNGGILQITANDLEVRSGAQLSSSVQGKGDAGNVVLEIRETALFEGTNVVSNQAGGAFSSVNSGGEGKGGDIQVMAGNLDVLDGAQLFAGTDGIGRAGNIVLDIRDTARFSGSGSVTRNASGAISSVELNGNGRGGNVRVNATDLIVTDGAVISAATEGTGDAGDVTLDIHETALIAGIDPIDGSSSAVASNVQPSGMGEGGDVTIKSGDLVVIGALVSTDTRGIGNAGDLTIATDSVRVLNGGQIAASTDGFGNSGNVTLNVNGTLFLEGANATDANSSGILSFVRAESEAEGGDIQIFANRLEAREGAVIGTAIFTNGEAGNVMLEIGETIRLQGINAFDDSSGGVFSSLGPNATGQSGNIQLVATNLEVLDGAQVSAATFGRGDAGNVILKIQETARFAGVNAVNGNPSGASSGIATSGEGNGGTLQITANDLEVRSGAQLGSSVQGKGDAGNVILEIRETALFEGTNVVSNQAGGAFSSVNSGGEGKGGDIQVTAGDLDVLDGAQLFAGTSGIGRAGNIVLDIRDTARFSGSGSVPRNASGAISSVELNGNGRGGNVRVTATDLIVTDGAIISAATEGTGDAGDVTLDIHETALIAGTDPVDGSSSAVVSNVQSSGVGEGGNVTIGTGYLRIQEGGGLFSGSLGEGKAGDIVLNVRDRLDAVDGIIGTNSTFNAGGQIEIEAGTITLRGNSDIQTFVNSGISGGGSIAVAADALVALDDSDIFAFATDGRGGDVDLSRTAFFGQNFQPSASAKATPLELESNNRVDINATGGLSSGEVSLTDVSFIENSLSELTDSLANPDSLIASSCIARDADTASTFTGTGRDGIPMSPNQVLSEPYSVGSVQHIPIASAFLEPTHIAEPQSVYRLADGRLLLSRQCQ